MADELIQQLENVLKYVAKSLNIKNYRLHHNLDKKKGDGYMSEFFTGKIFDEDKEEYIEVAVKKPPAEKVLEGITEMYKNEVNFYSEIIPSIKKLQKDFAIPKPFSAVPLYLAGSKKPQKIFVAMENLSVQGYQLHERQKYLDEEHLKYIFQTYGQFHALFFALKEKKPEVYQNITRNLGNEFAKIKEEEPLAQLLQKSVEAVVNSFERSGERDTFKKLSGFKNDFLKTFSECVQYKGEHSCIVHGDCWSNNMLFRYQESGKIEGIKLLDFQFISEGTPVYDLSYFFYSGASKTDMDHLDDYLNIYYNSFSKFIKKFDCDPEKLLPFEALKEDWKKYASFGVVMGIGVWVLKLLDQKELTTASNQPDMTPQKYHEMIRHEMNEIRANNLFLERTRNICLHAIEFGVLS